MKKCLSICALTFAAAALVFAAGVDGKYVSEQKFTPPNGGEERTITTTFVLKAEGDKLTGTVTTAGMSRGGNEPRPIDIVDGKIEGNKLTFFTVTTTQRGEMKWKYEATLDGDTLAGKRTREGGEGRGGGRMGTGEFTAKRQ